MAAASDDHQQIRLLLSKINDAWLRGGPEDIPLALNSCFHSDIRIKGPGFQEMATGKEACIRSYQEFLRQAQIRGCTLSEPAIDVYGDTAVATLRWDMTYALNGQEFSESGHDLFVFARIAGQWLAAWRAMLP
ncbi:MAG TPA: nuclear transport factor 2 family protein [Terriglobales bacterium]|nr:nuclear transport factor 2 family protein [Terriglobales bacterium]